MIEAPRGIRPAILMTAVLLAGCAGPEGDATLLIDTGEERIEVAVEVADSAGEQARGLMGREQLASDAGMVFLVDEPVDSAFWMKDTLIPLSIAFWGQDGRIARILDMDPCREDSCPLYEPQVRWIGAVEVNQGFFEEHGVQVGDTVQLER